ncbi:MAG: hypothetical protein ACRDL6_03200 [Solirubrobacterales bacterium]
MKELVKPDDSRDLLRAAGALLFGVGVLVLSVRKDEPVGFVGNEGWGHGALLILYLIAALILYGGAIATFRDTGELRKWQAIASVFGLLFVPMALGELVDILDGDPGASLNTAWIAAVTAGLAAYAGLHAGIRFQLLVGSIALLVAHLALWDKILSDGIFEHLGALRALLLAYAALLLAGGVALWRRAEYGLVHASELFTGAGIAAVLGTLVLSLSGPLVGAVSEGFAAFGVPGSDAGTDPSVLWDAVGLLVALALIVGGALIGTRGPVYVGAIGLLLFALIVGYNLDADPGDRENGLVGWPLILLVLGGVALVLSLVREASLGDRPKQLVDRIRGS